MSLDIENISKIVSNSYNSTLELNLDQFQRNYIDGYSLNFFEGFRDIVDFSAKNYTNFYLSKYGKYSSFLINSEKKIESSKIFTYLKIGSKYLSYVNIDISIYKNLGSCENLDFVEYKKPIIGESLFYLNLEIFDNNRCHIFYVLDDIRFYMACDVTNNVFFIEEDKISFSEETINPQDFTYIYSETLQTLTFLKDTQVGTFYLNVLEDELILSLSDDKSSMLFNGFQIEKPLNLIFRDDFDVSFITYDSENNIDESKSIFGNSCNTLFHKNSNRERNELDSIILKNNLSRDDVFVTGNTLLSNFQIPVGNDRNYCSISESVKQEKTGDLLLNYTFNNEVYHIKKGTNNIISPDNMYPFDVISVHDTKFIDCGAFAAYSPEFSDKIYSISPFKSKFENGQTLLCTWLSGSSDNAVWVDRYYYPDISTKEESLSGKPLLQATYDRYIEILISNNQNLKESIDSNKFFDKKSDLLIEPSKKYQYERVNFEKTSISQNFNYCEQFNGTLPTDYYTKINESGFFNVSFYFPSNKDSWILESSRNDINAGLTIRKTTDSLEVEYRLYDTPTKSFINIEKKFNLVQNNVNFFAASIDSLNGFGYFILNDDQSHEFKIPLARFFNKNIIYGDFYIDGQIPQLPSAKISNFTIFNNFIDINTMRIKPISDGYKEIEDIYITLPCGSRNGEDNLDQLAISNTNSFKSSNINVYIKNMGINNDDIVESLESEINNRYQDFFPVNSNVINTKIKNYK